MKLSGAFNEFSSGIPSDVQSLTAALQPYADLVFSCFKGRVMFGSDWPVCNVGGPAGDKGNWGLWREVVEKLVSEQDSDGVWWKAGVEAYDLES